MRPIALMPRTKEHGNIGGLNKYLYYLVVSLFKKEYNMPPSPILFIKASTLILDQLEDPDAASIPELDEPLGR